MSRRPHSLLPLIAVTLLLVGAACGVRTAPRPPEDSAAEAPDNFKVQAGARGIELSWKRVERSVDGQRLYDLAGFIVERRLGDEPAFDVIATISVVDNDRIRSQQKFEFRDASPPSGRLAYRVRAYTEDGERGEATAIVAVESDEPSTIPARPAESP